MKQGCKPGTVNRNRTTYWPNYVDARSFALEHNLPTDRIIGYGLGWAIQKHISGPYFNVKTMTFE